MAPLDLEAPAWAHRGSSGRQRLELAPELKAQARRLDSMPRRLEVAPLTGDRARGALLTWAPGAQGRIASSEIELGLWIMPAQASSKLLSFKLL